MKRTREEDLLSPNYQTVSEMESGTKEKTPKKDFDVFLFLKVKFFRELRKPELTL